MTPHHAIKAAQHVATDLTRCEVESIILARVSESWTLPDESDPRHAFADWNDQRSRDPDGVHGYGPHVGQRTDTTMARLMNILERMGVEIEWADEWVMCDGCGRMLRSSPDCWDWKMFGYIDDCIVTCGHCIDSEEYIEPRINNPRNAVNIDLVDLGELGFSRLDKEYESGMHPGQDDDPAAILKTLQAQNPGQQFVFVYEPSQFYVEFSAWSREVESDDCEVTA